MSNANRNLGADDSWTATLRMTTVPCEDAGAFVNANAPVELQHLQRHD